MSQRPSPVRCRSRLAPAILALAAVALGFVTLIVRLEVTEEGYRLSALRKEIAGLQESNRSLRLTRAELSSHQRLRALAVRYRMAAPARGQVVVVAP